MGLFRDAPPREHPEYTQLRFMAAGEPAWWKKNRHKVLAIMGLVVGFWLAGHHHSPPSTCVPASTSGSAR